MGKGNRNRKSRKEDSEKLRGFDKFSWRNAQKAEARGNSIGLNKSEYIKAHERGPRRVCEALIARHNARINRTKDLPSQITKPVRSKLLAAVMIDGALITLNRNPRQMPADYLGSWEEHLLWATDSCFAVLRHLSSGQFIAAALILRTQIERWTNDLASTRGTEREKGESNIHFMDRVWHEGAFAETFHEGTTQPTIGLPKGDDYENENTIGDRESAKIENTQGDHKYPAGSIYAELSELLHARGRYNELIHWEMGLTLSGKTPSESENYADLIASGVALVLSRIRARVHELLPESETSRKMLEFDDSTPAGENGFPISALWPLTYETCYDPKVVAPYTYASGLLASISRGERPYGRLFRDNEMVDICFTERRFRALIWARHGFEDEKKFFGEEFNPDSLADRQFRMIITSEFASLLSHWTTEQEIKNAASAAASSLRSSYWLWLDDDDRAMGMLRVVTEQAARIRTWNRKPEKAASLERNKKTTPKDWIEKSGLKRISSFNSALGEMAHAREGNQWIKAREVLSEMQTSTTAPEPIKTARGFALDTANRILASEVMGTFKKDMPELAIVFDDALREANVDYKHMESSLEKWYNLVHGLKPKKT
ncbi:hypothetical protein [Nocardiopsis deserti]|uniref:hypothetical protein n=1 Tax=Nocardiopsis deserti TaxID=2605988 RepID=UPI00123C281F|nr:hypothetical protein [Nocardiopsis deserti]